MSRPFLLLPAALLGLMACRPPHTPTTPDGASPAIRAAIQAGDEAWSTAYIAGDTAAMRLLYTPDVVSMQADEPDITGQDAMVAALGHGFVTRTDTTVRIETVIESLEQSDSLAWEVGHVTLFKRPRDAADATPVGHRYKYITFWQQGADGRWRIRRDLGVGAPLP